MGLLKLVHIVDDNEELVSYLADLVSSLGFHVMTFNSVEEAICSLGSNPSFIITDLIFPTNSGITLVHEVRKFSKRLPILIMTGYETTERLEETKSYDNMAFTRKPFSIEVLQKFFGGSTAGSDSASAAGTSGKTIKHQSEGTVRDAPRTTKPVATP